MKRAALALLPLVLASCVTPPVSTGESFRPPNIVLILVDDLGWRDLGCYGSDFYQTPRIDSLARQGLRFTNAYAAASVCSPTRASLMSGLAPARLHITDWIPGMRYPRAPLTIPAIRNELPLEVDTLAERLKRAGYATFHVGKWHLGKEPFWPEKQGFDVNVGGNDKGQPGSYFHPYRKVTKAGDWTVRPLGPGGKEGDYLTDRLTDEALRLMESAKDRPFFLNFNTYTVHAPYQAKKELVKQYRKLRRPGQRQNNATYAAMVHSLDENVGRLLDGLERLGIADNTLVIFTSDNGGVHTVSSNEPLRAGKGYLYEGGVRVPFIVRWPGRVPPGGQQRTPIITTDLFPTLLRSARAPLGWDERRKLDGQSLLPLFRGSKSSLGERPLFWHYPHYHTPGRPPCGAVRLGHYKLIEWYEDGRLELYNVFADQGETRDLSQERPGMAHALRNRLHTWLHSVGAQRNNPNPAHDPQAPFKNPRVPF